MHSIRRSGFTLIEVMIVVAIMGVLAAIAIPSYSEYSTRGRIVDAVSPLGDMQAKLEQYFLDNRTYVGACAAGTLAPLPAASSHFAFDCPTRAAAAYAVTATGQNAMAGFVFRLELANGVVTRSTQGVPSGWTTPSTNNCWVLKKNGSC